MSTTPNEPTGPFQFPPFIVIDRAEALDIAGALGDLVRTAREVADAAERMRRIFEDKLLGDEQ
jgi:hypothetical protein